MASKLTLLLDEKAILRAKKEALRRSTSVSRMVENYFMAIGEERRETLLPPLTASLYGILRDRDISASERDEYRKHLEEKYR